MCDIGLNYRLLFGGFVSLLLHFVVLYQGIDSHQKPEQLQLKAAPALQVSMPPVRQLPANYFRQSTHQTNHTALAAAPENVTATPALQSPENALPPVAQPADTMPVSGENNLPFLLDGLEVLLEDFDPAETGSAILRIRIDENGTATEIEFMESSLSPVMENLVRQRFMAAHYQPGMEAGRAISGEVLFTIGISPADSLN